ncbi:RagB/SusD family nutrient uptake outer membrane protein [Flammeovirga sp. MY04]|uniref:RagB/SusD family nutrient uptake outer membrane protein n=1 Tax=Flammeovirga sp. MY04 TaxID=1191459 RepID=UPI0008061222|nr:RagB/SusD family nutrient uptake outer membrane protein [Flammeovirga sp. MY04]ANQ52310.1 RagB/SusD family nutrient uptake outer membrane protein [Flammeovirga sp. MY04]
MRNIYKAVILATTLALATSCTDDYLDRQPSDSISKTQLLATPEGAEVAINGVYRNMYKGQNKSHDSFGETAVNIGNDIKGEDLYPASRGHNYFIGDYNWQKRLASYRRTYFVWYYYYGNIANLNEVINATVNMNGDQDQIDNVRGQALTLRGYFYFKLIQMYQFTYKGHENAPGVPLYTEPSVAETTPKDRATVQEVYDQILSDLVEGQKLLKGKTPKHISNVDEHVADGILARVYLVMDDWDNAAKYASAARSGFDLLPGSKYSYGFSKGSKSDGWIWGMEVNAEQKTTYNSFFSHMDNTAYNYASLGAQKCMSKVLYDQLGDDDVRKVLVVDPNNISDDKPYTEVPYMYNKFVMEEPSTWAADYVLMRAEEMLLIEAEAKAELGQDATAASLLQELVAQRDANKDVSSLTGDALKQEIDLQRRVELWGEGHRMLDILRKKIGLDRTNSSHDEVLAAVMKTDPEDYRMLLQIPQEEFDANPNIKIQNK